MGADLIATAVPKLTEREYLEAIDNADARTLAAAAFNASYQANFGDDDVFYEHAAELIADEDPTIVDQIAERADAVEAIRTAARIGAQYVLKHMAYGNSAVYDASRLGGPDVLVVGGSSHGDDPFYEFRDVAVLAAVLAAVRSRT